MIAAVILPTLLFAAIVLTFYANAELRQIDRQRLATVHALSEAINRQIEVERATLRALRASQGFESGKWEEVYRRALRILEGDPTRRIVLFGANGEEIFNTLRPFGARLPAAGGPTPIAEALRTGDSFVSDLVMGAVSQRYVLGVYLPARTASGEEYVIAMGFGPDLIQTIVDNQGVPGGRSELSVVDRSGRLIARTAGPLATVGRKVSANYFEQIQKATVGSIEARSVDDRDMRVAFVRSAVTGWTVGIAIEAKLATAGLRQSLLLIGAGGFGLVVVAVGVGVIFARRTARAIVGLSNAAAALGRGEAVPQITSDLHEINVVATAISDADAQLRKAAADLATRATELRDSEARYRLIADNARDMILFADHRGLARYVSPSSQSLVGYAPEDLIGRPVVALVAPEDRTEFERFRNELVEGRGEGEIRYRSLRADGTVIWVEMGARALAEPGQGENTGFIAGVRDITARKLAEDEAIDATARAEAANEAKSDFLAHMSHELRTQLNAVIGFAQLLTFARDANLTEKQRSYIGHIATAGGQLLQLVTDLLDLAKIDAGQLRVEIENVDVHGVLGEVKSIIAPMGAANGIKVIFEPAAQRSVQADHSRLVQVLLNLCANAIKYNRPGGSVAIAAQDLEDGRLRVSVKDTGVGISQQDQANLFQPFQRFGPNLGVEGSGIGLSISKRLIELMGAKIGCASVVGEGSVFWVDLTLAGPAPD